MNGAESLIQTAVEAGVELCLANPGTTELHLVAALDRVPGIRAVLGLFEGVCTGAADGYARMAERPALTLLHLGPGFANGIANLHNARRARSPLLNLIGDQPSWHADSDAPLCCDIESFARPVSGWLHRCQGARDLARDTARALAAAGSCPGRVATLIVPADAAWGEASGPARAIAPPAPASVGQASLQSAARALRDSSPALLLLGAAALRPRGLHAAQQISQATGCRVLSETFPARLERGAGRLALERLAYFPEQVLALLAETRHLILAGASSPVAFFGYPGVPGRLVPESCEVHGLADPEQDVPGALDALAEELGASHLSPARTRSSAPVRPQGPLTPATLGAALAATQPEGSIVVDEGTTSGLPYFLGSSECPPHTYLGLTGGAIGQGLPCATGAALACPERPVIALQADGSAMYTSQALWTQAREALDVTTILCSNREYRILRLELERAGLERAGPCATALTNLAAPEIDWSAMARALGVPAWRVETAQALVQALERAQAEPGPHLIEASLP